MKQKKYRKGHVHFKRTLLCSIISIFLVNCASVPDTANTTESGSLSSSSKATSSSGLKARSTTNMNQIGQQSSTLDAPQIKPAADVDQLTVNQLRTYADRCSPNAAMPPPKGLDCSELNLRVKRLFRSEDRVTEALITLDRLGRNDTIDNALEDLEDGQPGLSFNSQAIAAGLAEPVTPQPAEPEESLEDFLNENGLVINAGAIIANTGQ